MDRIHEAQRERRKGDFFRKNGQVLEYWDGRNVC